MKLKIYLLSFLFFLICTSANSQKKPSESAGYVPLSRNALFVKNKVQPLNRSMSLLTSPELILTSSNNCANLTTNYSDASNSYGTQDPIFVFSTASESNLTCPSGSPTATYDWYKFNATNNSYDAHALNSNPTQNNLSDGGYLVVRTDGSSISEGRAWIWSSSTAIDIGTDVALCGGGITTLNGGNTSLTPQLQYYNPVAKPIVVTNNTIINVSFSATHTWVSDLGFYLKTPSGAIITLGPNQGNYCNSGNDVDNLVFTNQAANVFNFCVQPAPLTGIYNQYFDGVSNHTIDWSAAYNANANSAGWGAMIYDCAGADVGSLTDVIITFDFGGGNVVTLSSGAINSPINDNSCDSQSASTFQVPFVDAIANSNGLTIDSGVGVGNNAQSGYEWSQSTTSATGPWTSFENNSLTPSLNLTQDTWIRLQLNNGLGCTNESVVKYSVNSIPAAPAADAQSFCNTSATVADLVATGTDLKWFTTETGGSPLANTTVLETGSYYVSQSLNSCESTRTMVDVTINNTPLVAGESTSLTANAVGNCAFVTGTFNLNGVLNGKNTYDATGSSVSISYNGVAWVLHSTGYISSVGFINHNVTTSPFPPSTGWISDVYNCPNNTLTLTSDNLPQDFCQGATVANLTANGTDLKWYANETGGLALANTTVLTTGSYYVSQTLNSCESGRAMINVTISALPATPVIVSTAGNCSESASLTVSNYDASLTYASLPEGAEVNSLGIITGAVPGTAYTFTASNATCTSESSAPATISSEEVVTGLPTLTTVTAEAVCAGSSTNIVLSGLIPNDTGSATYKIGNGPQLTQFGTSAADGTFSFTTGTLSSAANGIVVEILKLTRTSGCSTTFTGKKVTLVVNAKPTLSTVTAAAACAGSATDVVLSGLVPNKFGIASYKINNAQVLTQEGTSTGNGQFSFSTGALPLAANGVVIEIVKISYPNGCETTFTGKKVTLVVNPKPTLSTVTAAAACAGSATDVVLSGLVPNKFGIASYKINNAQVLTQEGTSTGNGQFSFSTGALPLAANGVVIEIVKISYPDGCETTFTGKKVTLVVQNCNAQLRSDSNSTTLEDEEKSLKPNTLTVDQAASKITLFPNPASDILKIDYNVEIKNIDIFNMQGQRVITSQLKEIVVSQLPAGSYMIRIEDANNNVIHKKFIKK